MAFTPQYVTHTHIFNFLFQSQCRDWTPWSVWRAWRSSPLICHVVCKVRMCQSQRLHRPLLQTMVQSRLGRGEAAVHSTLPAFLPAIRRGDFRESDPVGTEGEEPGLVQSSLGFKWLCVPKGILSISFFCNKV